MNVDSLLEEYGTPETFEVELPKGEKLVFRHITSYGDLDQFTKDATNFARILRGNTCPPNLKALDPNSDQAAIAAFTIARLSVEPKLSDEEALKLLKAPYLVQTILNKIDATRMNFLNQAFESAVKEEKKDSSETESEETDSL